MRFCFLEKIEAMANLWEQQTRAGKKIFFVSCVIGCQPEVIKKSFLAVKIRLPRCLYGQLFRKCDSKHPQSPQEYCCAIKSRVINYK